MALCLSGSSLPCRVSKFEQPDDMAKFAHETTLKAFEECNREKDVASFIQLEFNKAHGYEQFACLDFPVSLFGLCTFSPYPSKMSYYVLPTESRAALNQCGVLRLGAHSVHRCVFCNIFVIVFPLPLGRSKPCAFSCYYVCARLPTNQNATAIFKSEH